MAASPTEVGSYRGAITRASGRLRTQSIYPPSISIGEPRFQRGAEAQRLSDSPKDTRDCVTDLGTEPRYCRPSPAPEPFFPSRSCPAERHPGLFLQPPCFPEPLARAASGPMSQVSFRGCRDRLAGGPFILHSRRGLPG